MHSFSQLNLPQIDLAADAKGARDWLRKTYVDFADIFWRGMDRWGTTDAQHRYLQTLLGRSRWITNDLASNCELQTRFGGWLVDQTCQMRVELPHRRLFHVTIINDWWLTSERQTVVVLGGVKHTLSDVMALGCFDGWLGKIEFQTVDHSNPLFGRLVQPHVHVLAWTDDHRFSASDSHSRMITSCRLLSVAEIEKTVVLEEATDGISWIPGYMSKAPSVAKHKIAARYLDSKFRLDDCKLQPVSAIRSFEILSQLRLIDLVVGGGKGRAMRRLAERWIEEAVTVCPASIDAVESARQWQKFRQTPKLRKWAKRVDYRPVIIRHDKGQKAATEAELAFWRLPGIPV